MSPTPDPERAALMHKRMTEDTPSSRLLSTLKALMARSEHDRKFGPAACRLACLEAIDTAMSSQADAEIAELRTEVEAQKARADSNFESYERTRDKNSEQINALRAQLVVAQQERSDSAAPSADGIAPLPPYDPQQPAFRQLRAYVAQRLADVASFNGCVGPRDEVCVVAWPIDPVQWCMYCTQGAASKLLSEQPADAHTNPAAVDSGHYYRLACETMGLLQQSLGIESAGDDVDSLSEVVRSVLEERADVDRQLAQLRQERDEAIETQKRAERRSDRTAKALYAVAQACADNGVSDTDDVPLADVVRGALSQLRLELSAMTTGRDFALAEIRQETRRAETVEASLGDLRAQLTAVIEQMRSRALVVGQWSVEGSPDCDHARAEGEADALTTWANRLETELASPHCTPTVHVLDCCEYHRHTPAQGCCAVDCPACVDALLTSGPPTTNLIEIAERIAREAHNGQRDTVTREPYIDHVARVVALVESEDEKIVAWLHDVVEDNPAWTFERLEAEGIPPRLIRPVSMLTRRQPYAYADYIDDIWTAGEPLAISVKVADLRDHLRPNCPARLRPRYEAALEKLTSGPPPPQEK